MPAMGRNGQPKPSELPETLKKSDAKAQRTYAKTYDAALEEYDDAERAARTAWAALKHTHEKVGDHWEEKPEYGASDDRAEAAQEGRPRGEGRTAGGVNARATKEHLMEQARELDVEGRSTMTKEELVRALEKESKRRTSGGSS